VTRGKWLLKSVFADAGVEVRAAPAGRFQEALAQEVRKQERG